MTLGGELWFGLFKNVEGEVQRRLHVSTNVFDALLLERFGVTVQVPPSIFLDFGSKVCQFSLG